MFTTCFIRPGADGLQTLVPAPMLPDEKELGDAVVAAREMLSAEGRKLGFVGFKIIEIETGRSAHEERL